MQNLENALYRDLGMHRVNLDLFDRYKSGKDLTKRQIEILMRTLRHYRNTQGMGGSVALKNALKNLQKNYVKKARRTNAGISLRSRLVFRKAHLKKVRKSPVMYRKAPFSEANLVAAKQRLRPTPRKTLANLALLAVKNNTMIPRHMLTSNQLKLLSRKYPPSLSALKMRQYVKLLREYASRGNNMNQNSVMRRLRSYGTGMGLSENNNAQHEAFERLVRGILFETRLKPGGVLNKIQKSYKNRGGNFGENNIKKIIKMSRGSYADRFRGRP
jgi:hypothetical protein